MTIDTFPRRPSPLREIKLVGTIKRRRLYLSHWKKVRDILAIGIVLFLFGVLTHKSLGINILYSFTGDNDGASPSGLLMSTNGYFYITMVNEGSEQWGVIDRINYAGIASPLYPFTGGTADGATPYAGLFLGTNGNFFGTTQTAGTNGYGTIFELTPGGALTGLHSFARVRGNKASLLTNADGELPSYALVQGTNGNLYGTTESAGTNCYGTLFEMTYKGAVTVLYSFTNNINGASPRCALLPSGGNFYGTTAAGGSNGFGTVFEITSSGQLTSLYSFTNGLDGATPEGALIKGTDGNLYGTATVGGLNGSGTVFQITPAGKLTPWYSFSPLSPDSPYYNPDGATPEALIQGTDGNFYGAAYEGGANGTGTIFLLTPSKVFTTLYSFTAVNPAFDNTNFDGANPIALVQGTNGSFYGTGYNGGAYGFGTFFSLGLPPTISSQPTNEIVGSHSNATFTVAASGATGCQWQFNDTSPRAWTNFTLSLTNVQPTNAGYYQVVLTNLNGVVTSSVVSLSISNAPISFSATASDLQYNDGQVTLLLTNMTGQGEVIIQASSDLKQWTPILTNPPTFGPIQLIDTQAGSYSARYYRAVIDP
jgi:uncharacterized repeat protein (TIGR03803 family)